MNKLEELIKQHIQSLEPEAQLRLLKPEKEEDWQLYVLTVNKPDLTKEKQLLDACYKIELETGESMSLFIYTQKDWGKQFLKTPIYKDVMKDGIEI